MIEMVDNIKVQNFHQYNYTIDHKDSWLESNKTQNSNCYS